mgnify:CR=1 FL=1
MYLTGDVLETIDTRQMNNSFGAVSPCGRFVASSGKFLKCRGYMYGYNWPLSASYIHPIYRYLVYVLISLQNTRNVNKIQLTTTCSINYKKNSVQTIIVDFVTNSLVLTEYLVC